MADENGRDDLTIASIDEIPDFATATEERAFWATHRVSQDVYEQMPGTADDEDLGLRARSHRPTMPRMGGYGSTSSDSIGLLDGQNVQRPLRPHPPSQA